jgi:hypothetical protein
LHTLLFEPDVVDVDAMLATASRVGGAAGQWSEDFLVKDFVGNT